MKRDAFQQQLEHGDFVESTIYNGEYYGTLKSSIEEVLAGHLDAHIIMDLAGVLALKRLTADIIAVYIGANLSSIKRRLLERGSSVDEVTWRLNKAIEVELTDAYLEHADVVIWNHDGTDFSETVKRVKEAIQ
ncbi:Guanylate kinase [compost metagenome]